MKRIITTGCMVFALCAGGAAAQERGGVGVTAAATGQMPVGDMADVAGLGLGGLAGVEVGMNPGLALTARAGYIHHLEKDDAKMSHIPLLGGLKLTAPGAPVYVAGEVGAVMTSAETEIPIVGGTRKTDETNLGWNVGVGTMAGPLDVRLSFNVWDADSMSESMTVGLSVGMSVWTF